MRQRTDKSFPNGFRTAKAVVASIQVCPKYFIIVFIHEDGECNREETMF